MDSQPAIRGRFQAAEAKPGTEVLRGLLLFLLVYTTWVWAGLRPSFHWVAVVAAAGMLVVAIGWVGAWRAVLRDPVFFLGLGFLVFLAIQWANAGRVQYFDVGHQRWTYTPPRWPEWPSAFAREDARQMLAWFFPAWIIALVLRARLMNRRSLRGMFTLMASSIALLAIFGVIQLASGTRSIYWIQPLQGHFFASFAYGNHAAPFFVLASSLAAGLLFRELFESRPAPADTPSALRVQHPWRVACLVPTLALCLTGAFLGFSRAGVVLAGAFSLFAMAYGWIRGWRVLSPAARVNFAALSLAAAGGVYFLVVGLGAERIQKEFLPKPTADLAQTVWERIDMELDRRPQFLRAAFDIWREHPWLGVGGWGYKYLVAGHVPEKYWPALERRGWANVHCDFLQFLAEFGLVGFGLLLGALGVLLRDAFDRRRCSRGAFWSMGMAGLALVVVFSAIDLPFRSPAILYLWVAMLAAMPMMCGMELCEPAVVRGMKSAPPNGRTG